MAQQHSYRRMRFGMTLMELLMVVAIMTILMAIAIPMVRPAFQDRQLREGSRQINAFFAGAKARAAETGRPAGVWIEASGVPGDPQYAVQLYMAEVSPNFTGSILGSTCTIDTTTNTLRFWTPWTPLGQQLDLNTETQLNQLTVLPENQFFIRFDHKGPAYPCFNNSGVFNIGFPNGIFPKGVEDPGGAATPPGSRPVGKEFEIIRGPSKSIVSPLTLPGDAVIDLGLSGVGVSVDANAFGLAMPGAPVVIMFNPSGLPGAVYVDNVDYPAAGSIYLLVGRRSKVIAPALAASTIDPELSNLADPANLWVTINNRTGAVTTEDNVATTAAATVIERIKAAREFARGSRQKGGR